ncbi:MAG: hypothetical protein OK438_03325 [Thaumarchaeota archaeon]|nr:hypothetical protein [Nitrososphaerota archaeon]
MLIHTSAPPSYARAGAVATYSEFGGFVAFFGGVYGNVTFTIVQVYLNGSMGVKIQANISQSGEAPPQTFEMNITDSVESPRQFPAVPPENLTRAQFVFEHTPLTFVANQSVSVPAGTYQTVEFTGRSSDGNVSDFWFERASGLAIQVEKGGAVLQLLSSNIVATTETISPGGSFLSSLEVIIVLWAAAALFFLFVIRKARGSPSQSGGPAKPDAGL